MLGQPEDPAVMQPQPLPHRVAALDGRVERAHSRLIPVRQPPADADDDVPVPLVELLQHPPLLSGQD